MGFANKDNAKPSERLNDRVSTNLRLVTVREKMKIRATYLTLIFLIFSVSAKDVITHTASRADGSLISYYLLQNTHDSDTLLLILHGSDCNSVLKIDSIFTDYKNVWPEADILLIEKYGINKDLKYDIATDRKDCPAYYLKNDSPEQRVADIKIVLDMVRKDSKYNKFIVLGGSEGAVIAHLVAANVDDIDATISFNGGGRWFIDDVLDNIASKYENLEEAKENINNFKGFAEHVLNSKPLDIQASGHGYHWWYQVLSIDQLDTLQNVKSPLLIVQGGRDTSVSPQKTDEMIKRLKDLGKENIEYQRYDELDHGLNNIGGESKRKEVISNMNLWLRSKLGNPNR